MSFCFENDIEIDNKSQETKYFADRYFQPIVANAVQSYAINDITKGNFGEAILRLGLGRNHNQSLRPTVSINGQTVTVPSDWRGYDQKDKERFFGILEIPVPYDILTNGTNTVSVTFSKTGGHVSSLTLQVFNFDTEINRNTESALSSTRFNSILSTQVRIAPNPTTSTFQVLLPPSIPSSEISIYTLNGRLVQSDRVDPSNSSISLKSLAPGLYLLIGKTDEGQFQKKISKL